MKKQRKRRRARKPQKKKKPLLKQWLFRCLLKWLDITAQSIWEALLTALVLYWLYTHFPVLNI